jgi:micrococcal nuclease
VQAPERMLLRIVKLAPMLDHHTSVAFYCDFRMRFWGFVLHVLFGTRPSPRSPITLQHEIRPFYRDPFGGATSRQEGAEPPLSQTLVGRCYVVDGDTIIIGNMSIRLAGIDAPEMDHPYGRNAKWALNGLCKGHIIRAEFSEAQSYNREVATCYLPDGRDLSAEMVKAGLAIDWAKHSGGKYRCFEVEGVRRRLWRADAKQKGRWPPPSKA